MNILNDNSDITKTNKPEIEQVEKKKQEYKLLDSFIHTPGLRLFGYNHIEDNIFELPVPHGKSIHLEFDKGIPRLTDYEAKKVTVDSRFEYFEVLNMENATRRVKNWKENKIKKLCNLRRPDPESIKLF